jgi:hypothetical protein
MKTQTGLFYKLHVMKGSVIIGHGHVICRLEGDMFQKPFLWDHNDKPLSKGWVEIMPTDDEPLLVVFNRTIQ